MTKPKKVTSWRTCPNCGSRATKIMSLATGKYQCQICKNDYFSPTIIKLLKEDLDNARENGHTFENVSDQDVAIDLATCSSNWEHWPLESLTALVHHARNP